MSNERPVRVRIAPSPTGDPHVGTAYVGLINYAFAKRNGGQFILRIEDTDRERSTKTSEEAIFESLRWLGLNWDEGPDVGGPFGPYRQSERSEIYREYVDQLVRDGHAYPCFCTPDELEVIRLRQREQKQNKGYDGTCRAIDPATASARIKAGEPHVIRLKVPDGRTTVQDLLRGPVEIDNDQVDDQVLLKSDGFPTYHLANVVDDHLMGVTHVIRAEEWINSTPKHLMLYNAFGWEPPVFVHLPLLRNKDKSKISKRKNPVSLTYYRQIGILPEAMVNFLALLGHSMADEREIFELDEFINELNFDRVSLGGPVFDIEKLLWLNGMRIRALDPEELTDRIMQSLYNRDAVRSMVPLVQERIRALGDFPGATAYFNAPDIEIPVDELFKAGKGMTTKEIGKLLKDVAELLDTVTPFKGESIENTLREWCDKTGTSMKIVFMALRLSVTGRKATPPLFETLEIVGRPSTTQRIRSASEAIQAFQNK